MAKHPAHFELPPSLFHASDDRAVAVLAAYYKPLSSRSGGYTGGQSDAFDPSGTRSASANTYTADDLVAVTLLSVEVPGRAAMELLVSQRRRFEVLSESLGTDRDLANQASVAESDFLAAWHLWRALSGLPGLGPTMSANSWLGSVPASSRSLTRSSTGPSSVARACCGRRCTLLSRKMIVPSTNGCSRFEPLPDYTRPSVLCAYSTFLLGWTDQVTRRVSWRRRLEVLGLGCPVVSKS